MLKNILVTMLSLAPTLSHADTVANARGLLEPWQPRSVSLTDEGVLRVVLEERRITNTIHSAVIRGFCFAPITGTDVAGVDAIFVLNESETQGRLFEDGVGACDALNQASGNEAAALIAASTSVHTDTANGL